MPTIDPSLRIGAVRLAVTDLPASVDFYSRVMGLRMLDGNGNGDGHGNGDGARALLGAGETPMLELTALERPTPIAPGSTGLFHVAWLHDTRAALAETVRRIGEARWPFTGASDHAVSEALYLDDPDGLGVEIYVDRPREQWQRGPDGRHVRMVTLPLDVEDLLAQSHAAPGTSIDEQTTIGHVHLKVSDVERSDAFYTQLGFEEQARMPSAAFVAAGGYHHHVGLNSWQSAGGAPAGEDAPGLRHVRFDLAGAPALAELASVAAELGTSAARDGTLSLADPDGHALSFATR